MNMKIHRFVTYAALALCACFGSSFALAMDRPLSYLSATFESIGELQASAMTRLDLTLAGWRSGGPISSESLASNMRAESNHFVMVSVAPAGVPDWDIVATA